MLFTHNNIDFDIDEREISKDECIKLFTPIIDIAKKFVTISEIVVESNDYATIFVEGDSEGEYAYNTIKYVDELSAYNIDLSLSDEDYGELDAINIYL